MYKLTTLLGFEPDTAMAHEPLFDMLNGVYVSRQPLHTHVIGGADKELWAKLATARLDDLAALPMTQDERQRLITMLEEYYTLHIPSFGGLKSHQVLHQLF